MLGTTILWCLSCNNRDKFPGGSKMEVLNNIKKWSSSIADVAVSLMALSIVLELLGVSNIPFFPEVNVIANVTGVVKSLGAEGLVGLIAVWVLYSIWNKK